MMTTPAGLALSYPRVFVCATTSTVYEFLGRDTTCWRSKAAQQQLPADKSRPWMSPIASHRSEGAGRGRPDVATTAADGSILGAELAESTSADALEKAYGVFAAEARLLDEDYAPETVCTEGGEARQSAWEKIFVAPVFSIIYLLPIVLGFSLGLSCTIPIPEMFQGHAYYLPVAHK